ncbi:winged helix-turn-helix domain-containing protein [Methanolobus sp.]|uniref:helix-turn-helix transcriptional regulator n=1 Tax=Methanolobus sp. TaxID=1874737 RepID=UPI0025D831B9|nr:winged helix-turn-helix domain-containing protein [Methanolobus sp.]
MRKQLLDVIFMSEKRKNVLLLLKDESKKAQVILNHLKTTRTALLPQMKVLEENHLVIHYDDTYGLTKIGELIVNEIEPLLATIEVLDKNIEYWGTHKLDFIPPRLLERIYELGKCEVITPSITNTFEIDSNFHEMSNKSPYLFYVTTFLYPNYSMLFSELISNNVNIHLIVSKDLLEKIRTEEENDFKQLTQSGLLHLFVYPDKMDFLTFAYNDNNLLLNALKDNMEFDNKHILSCNPSAIDWGKELFEYYLKYSTPVSEI